MVNRDCQGLVLASISQIILLPLTIVELETLAAAKALQFATDLGLSKVILERDSEIFINALNENSQSLASFGLLIQDVKNIANYFHCISFSHVRRDGNCITHNLIRHTQHVIGFSV